MWAPGFSGSSVIYWLNQIHCKRLIVYTFPIKQKDRSKILSVFHFLIALIFILDISHVHLDAKKDWIFSVIYLIACIFLLIAGIFRKKILKDLSAHLSVFLFESALILCGAVYFWSKGTSLVAVSHGILAGVVMLFWIYLKKRQGGETIIVSEHNVILPGLLGERIVEWDELTNLVKKYDLLTLDFKTNKLLQVQVMDADHINEDEFNQFCSEQLSK